MSNITWTVRWTPDGIITQRIVDGQVVAESRTATIEAALAGVEIGLKADQEQYEFPSDKYPTEGHILAEKLARGIEEALGGNDLSE